MTNQEAIAAIKSNWPTENYTTLRDALNMAIAALSAVPALYCPKCGTAVRAPVTEQERFNSCVPGANAPKPKPAKVRRAMPGDCDKCILDRFCAIPREGWRRKKDCKSYRDKIRRYMVGAKEGA
jgi:hypothetical protein